MELFIRIKDGKPFEHPILGDNFRQVFSYIDTDSLPPEFARFERIEQFDCGVYDVYEGVTYEWSGEIVKDVHHVRPMTTAEKANKIAVAMAEEHPDDWVFNMETCGWEPVPLRLDVAGSTSNQ